MSIDNKNGIFGKLFRKNLNTGLPESTENNDDQQNLISQIKAAIEEEKKKMDAMSRSELIDYAASTRVHLLNTQNELAIAIDGIYTIQQIQLVTIDTLNRVIKKKSVKPLDMFSVEDAKKFINSKA